MGQKNNLVASLTYLGALPFLVAALCCFVGLKELPYLGSVELLVYSYAIMIACFMAGTHWGYVIRSDSTFNPILVTSVMILLVLWVLWIANIPSYSLCLVPVYLLLWCVDYLLLIYEYESHIYFKMRTKVTVLVILSLLVIYLKT